MVHLPLLESKYVRANTMAAVEEKFRGNPPLGYGKPVHRVCIRRGSSFSLSYLQTVPRVLKIYFSVQKMWLLDGTKNKT